MQNIVLIDNELKAEDFVMLRSKAGKLQTPIEQAEKAINNSLFVVSAICAGRTVGMGRLVGDGAMYWYLQEIIVLPEYQGKGIGARIVNRLIRYVKENGIPETKMTIGLMAAKGKEPFYEKLGFTSVPDDGAGSGMRMYVQL